MVKLIASDLDGTLLQNGARDVNPIVFRPDPYIKRTRNPVRSSSGRQYLNLRRLFTPVQDDIAYIAKMVLFAYIMKRPFPKGLSNRILLTAFWMKLYRIFRQISDLSDGSWNTGEYS